jgi:TPR repeat protein
VDLAATKAAAEKGDPEAQCKFGQVYYDSMNYSTAAEWFRRSAEKGVVIAQRRLGQILINGMPKVAKEAVTVPKAPDEGFRWLLIAANQGDGEAQTAVAYCYQNGTVVSVDPVEAYAWFRIAYGNDFARTQIHLNPLIMKMTPEQVAEGEKRAKAFVPHKQSADEFPEPQYVKEVVLKGIAGPANKRMAIINNKTLAAGEQTQVKLSSKTVTVKCLEVKERSAVVLVEGTTKPRELRLAQ